MPGLIELEIEFTSGLVLSADFKTQQVLRIFFSNFGLIFQLMFPPETPGYEIRKKNFFVDSGSMLFRCDPICPFSTHRGTCR